MNAPRAGRPTVVNFHGIGEPPAHVPPDEVPFWCPLDDWHRIADVLAVEVAGGAAVAITFDDGNSSDVEHALPVLAERDLTATFHVCAGRLDLPAYVDGSAVQHLRSSGMSIGSHGWDHVDLRALSDPDLVRAGRDSRQRLGEVCGEPVTSFAVPLGSYDRRVLGHLRDYRTVLTSDATTWDGTDWIVPRWSYVRGWDAARVRSLARGGESRRHRWRQRTSMAVKRRR
ncbi:polysaccharide deacetylase family protein [Nocardioides glacieisoli]|uniref:polysaccharide deacetylase family protein n=1 Tax=Nocardioides glacieisoli TaxID=1168730 RepID=UPI0013EA694F|nr:polysaccharide deacetylase family protein [Nocardioides glacieisoli]